MDFTRFHIPNKKSDIKTIEDFKLYIKNRKKEKIKYGEKKKV